MKLGYDEIKCMCCGKVHVNSLLMDVRDEDQEHFIICFSCADEIYKFLQRIKREER